MNQPLTLTAEQLARATAVLSHPGLIRLVSEIDDNGPVRHRMVQRTFADLSRAQLRHALAAGREHRLVRAGYKARPCYLLTDSGSALAGVYDTAARWARAHDFPSTAGDFITRVQATLTLLGQEPVLADLTGAPTDAGPAAQASLLPDDGAMLALHRPWESLARWVRANPSVLADTARRSRPVAASGEFAA
jgi:DNA-binding HxlR family transcriptional regulator